jgi:hypothetical protein
MLGLICRDNIFEKYSNELAGGCVILYTAHALRRKSLNYF